MKDEKEEIEVEDITDEELITIARWLNDNSANMCQLLKNVTARHSEETGKITYHLR